MSSADITMRIRLKIIFINGRYWLDERVRVSPGKGLKPLGRLVEPGQEQVGDGMQEDTDTSVEGAYAWSLLPNDLYLRRLSCFCT